EYSDDCRGKRLTPKALCKGDDIVHPLWKHEDKCNPLVVGSSPTPGANEKQVPSGTCFSFVFRGGARTGGGRGTGVCACKYMLKKR
ncbi:hypothetical protein KKF59_01915, partial [Patescibacteria group bacterium]|nr:hypothetical protein [Patescibacteria group bacterium]